LEEKLEPRLAEAKEGKRTVYFADAAHFVCGAFLGYLWCIVRMFVPTLSGRKRYNVLGMINAITHDLSCVCNETYINALTVCDLLIQVKKKHTNTNPVTVVLDNARYQCCKLVKKLAEELKIELLFLPSYSPNLNIIERYWNRLKKDCLNCKYYDSFDKFKEAIDNSLKKTADKENRKELDTFLNLKFQLFDNEIYNRG
jgi:transposase